MVLLIVDHVTSWMLHRRGLFYPFRRKKKYDCAEECSLEP